ncbi:MAG TPA: ATP-binding cassette domain-containing protein [Baekduia sp.]|nr:ATP-binding cassette domain-containing protein [Baekduia sp.]
MDHLHDTLSAAATLRDALADVIDGDRPAVRRLGYAHTSVAFHVAGDDRVALLLDRVPVELVDGAGPAEVELDLTPEQAARFARGALHLPSELEARTVAARGPVRKYLEVDPILREALRRHAGGGGADGARTAVVEPGTPPLDADLLAIETRDLHKGFGSRQILTGTDLRVPEGVISVVLGPSGTGKSVLLNHVIGLMRPDRGDVLVRGRSLNSMSRSEVLALRLEVGVMFQDGALFSAMDVFDNVAFPLRQHTDLSEAEVHDIVMRHLGSVGLADAVRKRPGELSGGMRKRAGLARALVLDPGIILCDEPDSGLDPVRTALLAELLAEQHGEMGGTMVVITHNIALARRIAEHVSVLWQGKVLEAGPAEQVFDSETPFVRQFLSSRTDGPLSMDA